MAPPHLTVLAAVLAAAVLPTASQARGPDARLVRLVQAMTLEEKVGQLFVTFAYGDRADTTDPADVAANRALYGVDNAAQLVRRYHVGGVIYFVWSNNVRDPRQIAGLSNGIQRAGLAQRLPLPLLISIDQEGGLVARIGPPATQFPGNMALGAGRRTADALRAAAIAGRELRALGITGDYAPVADVNVNPANPVIGVRSFGADPGLVSRMTVAQVRGYRRAGVTATAKHFPGHGDTDVDSHLELPTVEHSRSRLEEVELRPFKKAIEAGVASIMTAHVLVRELDDSVPATLSPRVIDGLLRRELKYDGVIVTDDLEMKAVAKRWAPGPLAVLAARAGCDLLPVCATHDMQVEALEGLVRAVESGEISWSAMDGACGRVRRLKERFVLPWRDPDPKAARAAAGAAERVALARSIAEQAGMAV
jgi:beta-N-acetylhexosaminidase